MTTQDQLRQEMDYIIAGYLAGVGKELFGTDSKIVKPINEDQMFDQLIAIITREISSSTERLEAARKALQAIDDWFENIKKQQYELLVHNQSLESAAENWDKIDDGFDMTTVKAALQALDPIAPPQS